MDVIIDSGDEEKPYIAKIVEVDTKRRNVYVTWYYRPEDSLSGRLLFHGKQELFESDHCDWVSVDTVVNACNVYSLQEYEEAKINENPDEEKLNYFTRFFFSAKRNRFNECSVRLYCICNQPQNPDKLMISCDSCTDWYGQFIQNPTPTAFCRRPASSVAIALPLTRRLACVRTGSTPRASGSRTRRRWISKHSSAPFVCADITESLNHKLQSCVHQQHRFETPREKVPQLSACWSLPRQCCTVCVI